MCAPSARARLCGTRIRCIHTRARAGAKRTASRSADGTRGRPFASHRVIASSRLPVPARGRRRRARDRSFDSTTSIRYLSSRRRPTSVVAARARARRRRSVVRVSRGRSRRHESNRIEFESNLNRIESARRDETIVTGRVVPSSSDRRRVSSRLVSSRLVSRRVVGLASRRRSRGRSPCHTRTFSPVLIHATTTHPRVCGRDES